MANIQSAKKRARQTIVKNELKSAQRASVRTAIKSVEQAIEAKDKDKPDATMKYVPPCHLYTSDAADDLL